MCRKQKQFIFEHFKADILSIFLTYKHVIFLKIKKKERKPLEIRDKMVKFMNTNSPQFNLYKGKELGKLNYQSPRKSQIMLQSESRPIPSMNLEYI